MSEVISFRLDRNNPREALAFQLLERWRKEGHPIRQVVTEALLIYGDLHSREIEPELLYEMSARLSSIEQLLRRVDYPIMLTSTDNSSNNQDNSLNDAFVTAIRNAAKNGIKLNSGSKNLFPSEIPEV